MIGFLYVGIGLSLILMNCVFSRLYEYQFDDFEFLPERRPDQTDDLCGPTRKCQDGTFSNADDPWQWSANRIMTPRLAIRMKILAIIAKNNPELNGNQ